MDIKAWLGTLLPFHFAYFDPANDWFDLGAIFVLIGLLISWLMLELNKYRFKHVKYRLKPDYYREIRWWIALTRALMTSALLVVVIKVVLIFLGIY